jgi:AraC-like DNA-binding protein
VSLGTEEAVPRPSRCPPRTLLEKILAAARPGAVNGEPVGAGGFTLITAAKATDSVADLSVRWSLHGPQTTVDSNPQARVDAVHPGSTYLNLARTDGVSVVDVRCNWHVGSQMRETFQAFGLCMVRRGTFVRQSGREELIADSTTAYFEQPGVEQLVSHPLGGDGRTTVIVLADEAMARYAGDVVMPDRLIPVGREVQLLHARLLTDVRAGLDEPELDGRLTALIGRLVETVSPGRLTARRPATARSHRRIVDRAREAIAADPSSLDLIGLASELGHTPYHVSRVFHRATGVTLTAYRNALRIAVAIDRIGHGDENFAVLAADLGFVDQSHLARTLQRAVGMSPRRLRHWLTGRQYGSGSRLDNDIQDSRGITAYSQ